MAWKDPMGRPNCSRSFAYWRVVSKIARQVATVERATAAVACSSTRVTAASARGSPGSNSTRSSGTGTACSVTVVTGSVGSSCCGVEQRTTDTGTTKTPRPASPRATTASSVAEAASTTCDFTPSRTQVEPSRRAAVLTAPGSQRPSSASASDPVTAPEATSPRKEVLPASRSAGTSWVTVAR